MTIRMTDAPRRLAIPAALMAAMLLAGCSSGNIGESWQCPLADTGSCDSVAAADPAVPDTGASRKTLLTEPLWRQRGGEPGSPAPAPCEAECSGGFDPFGWLTRLFGEETRGSETGTADKAAQKSEPMAGETVAAPSVARTGEPRPEEPGAVALPAEPASLQTDMTQESARAGDLRTGEVVARIWIAPFVDADGVYREASHVRVVLEPAGWRVK